MRDVAQVFQQLLSTNRNEYENCLINTGVSLRVTPMFKHFLLWLYHPFKHPHVNVMSSQPIKMKKLSQVFMNNFSNNVLQFASKNS